MQLVLNEISTAKEPRDQYTAWAAFSLFLSVYSDLVKKYASISRDMLTSCDINSIELSPGYSVAQWRNSDIDRELKRRFLSLCEHQKIVVPTEEAVLCNTYSGECGMGLQLAAEIDAPLISFSFLDEWKRSQIPCSIYRTVDDVVTSEFLYNFSTKQTVLDNQAWLVAQARKEIHEIKTPDQLIEKLDTLFPSLVFIDNASRQIERELSLVTTPIVAEKLYQLEVYFSGWDGLEFRQDGFPARTIAPESQSTLNRFTKEHTFLYGEQEILVSFHMRYTNGDYPGRIYFYPDHVNKKCVICSLTSKLPTVTEPKFRRR